MKKMQFFLFTLCMTLAAGSLSAQKFGRYQVAIIAEPNDRVYSAMVQKALSEDKRFLFISEKDIPFIIKEWERRQSGITEDDSITLLKNVDYFVAVTNVQNSGPIQVIHKDKKGNITITYKTSVSMDIKVTDIQGGGEVKSRSASGGGESDNPAMSQQDALRSLQSSVKVAVTILFPINAELFDITSTHVKMLSGSQQGVKNGQKYIIKSKKIVNVRDQERTFVKDIGLVQIKKVNDDDSEAFVIFLDDLDDKDNQGGAWAEEKYFSNIAFEFSLLGTLNRGILDSPLTGLFGAGVGMFLGNLFQYGVSVDGFLMGRYMGISPSIELRYNLHIYKGFYLLAGLDGGMEMIYTLTNMRVPASNPGTYTGTADKYGNIEVKDQQVYVRSLMGSVTVLAGVKLFFTPNFYSILTVGYIYSPDTRFKFIKDKDTPTEQENSIIDYNAYIPPMAPRGGKIGLTVGYLF